MLGDKYNAAVSFCYNVEKEIRKKNVVKWIGVTINFLFYQSKI